MIISLTYQKQKYTCDLSKPLDISIPVGKVKCFFATDYKASPFQSGDFVGAVKAGAPVNFFDVLMNPHGNGTHTECLGHITLLQESLHDQLKQFHFFAQVISVPLETLDNGDQVISKKGLQAVCSSSISEALVLRTLPNSQHKLSTDYSGQNPPYVEAEAMTYLVSQGVRHLLLDLPSVDREEDNGTLAAHHIFWNVNNQKALDDSRKDCTISELIFVNDEIKDGLYLLNIQIPSLILDAAPSKPTLYKLHKDD